ncbi:uncharacterized protein LOC126896139 [Daktulosphaira vitifoliae]|uniref:uncharacterized protein LOC126896139 n=1 Tax=Daktulosphaira vitifoliae TaxID=58002 RepID=UPI0021AAEBD0|nr:uncharacterized protein LOC126896139 [Daktulosphaira vitifoliae]
MSSKDSLTSVLSECEEFQAKRTNLFAVLDQAEKDLESKIPKAAVIDTHDILNGRVERNRSNRSLTKQFRGKSSLFAKPDIPPWRILEKNKMPDYKLHPHKWTKYSLADVNEMNDKSNAAAAFAFLKEMKTRKIENTEENLEKGTKIVFKRVEKSKEEDLKPFYKSSKLVMPEYEFGKKIKKKKTVSDRKINSNTITTIKLGHLIDEEDIDD